MRVTSGSAGQRAVDREHRHGDAAQVDAVPLARLVRIVAQRLERFLVVLITAGRRIGTLALG